MQPLMSWFVVIVALPVTCWNPALQAEPPLPSANSIRLIGDTELQFGDQRPTLAAGPRDIDLGHRDFIVGVSFATDERVRHDLGDLISLWNADTRHGFHLGLRNNTGCTGSQSNWRQLQFGIDAGTEPAWRDEGRPGASLYGFALCVHDGALYIATCEPGRDQAGRVYRYAGPGDWTDLGRLDGANAVTALASYRGRLYAATGKYRLGGSALPESENAQPGGKVYRLDANDRWELVGDLSPTEAVAALVNFDGQLYASSLYRPAGFFRYEADGRWTALPTPNEKRVEALAVHNGSLYAGSYDSGSVYRFDGERWSDLGLVGENTQTYSFATYMGHLHVGTWPSGRVFRLSAENQWADTGRLGEELEVMGMLVHNGAYYAGTLPLAQVYRYDIDRWTPLKQLDVTPDVKYRRVWTMATFQGRLFCTTLPSGKVWSMNAGACVTCDRELPAGWHKVVAQRKGNRLKLFVDGVLAAESFPFEAGLSLATRGVTLKVGDGPRGPFRGQMKDVWVEPSPIGRE
jgi:hypothetical protein